MLRVQKHSNTRTTISQFCAFEMSHTDNEGSLIILASRYYRPIKALRIYISNIGIWGEKRMTMNSKETVILIGMLNKHSIKRNWHFFLKLKWKLFSNVEQKMYECNLEVVRFTIIYTCSRTSQYNEPYCVNTTTTYIHVHWYWFQKLGVGQHWDIGSCR